jgi:hypothetical protein
MEVSPQNREDIKEGRLTRTVEEQTAKIPSMGYLSLALGSMALSAATALVFKRRALGNFFGLWAPSFLLLGLYNKVVKLEANIERSMLH